MTNDIPDWQVNPRSKQTDPEIAQAYRDAECGSDVIGNDPHAANCGASTP